MGIPPFSASAHVRDITIDLTDSCNCCCPRKRDIPTSSTPVYVNSHGVAVRFDPRKAEDERKALQRAVTNLKRLLMASAEASKQKAEDLIAEVEETLGSPLEEENPPSLQLGTIEKVNGLLHKLRGEKSK